VYIHILLSAERTCILTITALFNVLIQLYCVVMLVNALRASSTLVHIHMYVKEEWGRHVTAYREHIKRKIESMYIIMFTHTHTQIAALFMWSYFKRLKKKEKERSWFHQFTFSGQRWLLKWLVPTWGQEFEVSSRTMTTQLPLTSWLARVFSISS